MRRAAAPRVLTRLSPALAAVALCSASLAHARTSGSTPAGGAGAASAAAAAPPRAASIRDASANAFGFPAPALSAEERRAFAVGNSFFKQNWVEAPSSTSARDGLGPFFHARSCSGCHVKDGRSRPPEPDERNHEGLMLAIGLPVAGAADLPHPVYGNQLHESAVLGVAPKARVRIEWQRRAGTYGDGTPFELVEPRYEVTEPGYGPLGDDVVLGGRTAPHLVGMGLLEAVSDATILSLADPDDADGDGISGRPHRVGPDGSRIGRFGWRAMQPDVLLQTAAALVNDIGITSAHFPDEAVGASLRASVRGTSGGSPEIDDWTLERLVFYTRALAVPEPRDTEREAFERGRAAFLSFGCAGCHVPTLETGDHAFHPAYARRTIEPYTDLLLHDLGPGLADGKREGDALPSEWRTAPLWGIGLVPVVNGHSRYLHDGRARDLAEAILWHAGEAQAARERFRTAPREERAALLEFVASI